MNIFLASFTYKDKKRSADISAITWINQRNRNKMKEQFLGDNVQIDMGHQDDPFTRKKDRMKVLTCSFERIDV
uniref:DDE_Tnp_1_7 domain-containing protein n=1 Tax=Heterorhabditis bacteriophora TaxID=37862 RepID=A0A1I7XMJ7_HETBA